MAKANALQRETRIPKEVMALLKGIGVDVPDNIKEIETEVVTDASINQIKLPPNMDKLTAAKELEAQYKNEENKSDYNVAFEGFNYRDVLVAIRRVTEAEFGWMNGQKDWYGGNPTEIDIVVDLVKGKPVTEKGFLGVYKVTGWDNADCNVAVTRQGIATLTVTAKKKFSKVITTYFNLIREQLTNNSIYKGRSIQVTMNPQTERMEFEIIENKGAEGIILNHDESLLVNQFVLGSLGESGKRCYLFAGAYGTGKTETAMMVGREATKKNIGFFYLRDSASFDMLMEQAKKYQPCVIFMEDIDEIASGEERDARMNTILNTLDGFATKGNDLTVIFTTNHAERIAPALKRPGRIDLMIKFELPDQASREAIYRHWFKNLKGSEDIDYSYLASKTPDVTGAVVSEICKRAVLLAKKRGNEIDTNIVESCVVSMKFHIDLMSEKSRRVNKEKLFVDLFRDLVYGDNEINLADVLKGIDYSEAEA